MKKERIEELRLLVCHGLANGELIDECLDAIEEYTKALAKLYRAYFDLEIKTDLKIRGLENVIRSLRSEADFDCGQCGCEDCKALAGEGLFDNRKGKEP